MAKHAILSPSAASRWMVCTPSARLEQKFPDSAGEAAAEGTLAHEIGSLLILHKIGKVKPLLFKTSMKVHQANTLYQPEMLGYCEEYAAFVLEHFADAQSHTKEALLFLEEELDLTDYIPKGHGTGDTVIIADTVMEVIDLKYGQGVPVSAEKNIQMMIYALGALAKYGFAYDIETVRMSIFQPRIDNHSTWDISVKDLMDWSTYLVKVAKVAFEGEGEFKPGKHCMFCRARAQCKANAAYQLELAKYDFKDEVLMSDKEIADILQKAPEFIKWLTAVKNYALYSAVVENKTWPGYKLVEGISRRKYSDIEKVDKILKDSGWKDEEIYKKELIGITALTGLITKPVFTKLIEPLLVKPPGKPALALMDDKRPELDRTKAAVLDFKDDDYSDD